MNEGPLIDVPPEWEQVDVARLRGTLLIIGASDVGKSTFARYLFQKIQLLPRKAAFLDGDPGQSALGPPTTMTLAFELGKDDDFTIQGQAWRSFVGALSPSGHMLQLLTGADRLVRASRKAGAQVTIYDTTGLIDPNQGGMALKLAKIDLLRPTTVFALQREKELEFLLKPLRRTRRVHVEEIHSSLAARQRDLLRRQGHRSRQFGRYFSAARILKVIWPRLAVFPAPRFTTNRLVAFEDAEGFTLGLGIVEHIDYAAKEAAVLTPLTSLDKVDAIRLGSVVIDPRTFEHRHINRGEQCLP
jgi:polynucleotide 5'-hydroxyl-kinase GRC3/NOL9